MNYWDLLPKELQCYILQMRKSDPEHLTLKMQQLQQQQQKILVKMKKVLWRQYCVERSQRRLHILQHWTELTAVLGWPTAWKELWKQYFESHHELDWFYEQDSECTTFFMFTTTFVAPGHQWPEEMRDRIKISRYSGKNVFDLRHTHGPCQFQIYKSISRWNQILQKQKELNLE